MHGFGILLKCIYYTCDEDFLNLKHSVNAKKHNQALIPEHK